MSPLVFATVCFFLGIAGGFVLGVVAASRDQPRAEERAQWIFEGQLLERERQAMEVDRRLYAGGALRGIGVGDA